MSQSSIDRWNAIPLSRTDQSMASSKHPGPSDNENDDDDDDVSLVSRSPSPNEMDIDKGLDKYDEYVRGVAREVITIETKIKPSNKGFAMLRKLGWSEGQPLGVSGDGRIDPIPFQMKMDSTGLGKISQDVKMIETTVSQRREMDSERQQKESEGQRRAREELVARKSAIKDEISSTLKAFFCTLCDKQFQNVAQYDEHTNSYAHHHKARFKDMQANIRLKPKDEVDKRKEKERKREEKELRKIAAANGIKMAKPTPATSLVPVTDPALETPAPRPAKTGGWATITGTPQAGPSNSGWKSFGPTPIDLPDEQTNRKPSTTPGFRAGGWTSLDSTSISPEPILPASAVEPLRPPPLPVAPPPPPPSDYPAVHFDQGLMHVRPPSPPSKVPLPPMPPAGDIVPKPESRSNWQRFKSGVRRR